MTTRKFKIPFIIGVLIFFIERVLTPNGFLKPLDSLFVIFAIHQLYAFTLTFLNAYFFDFISSYIPLKNNLKLRLILGFVGSILLTMLTLYVLRFVTEVIFFNRSFADFWEMNQRSFLFFGLSLTIVVSLVFHLIYYYKENAKTQVNTYKILANNENAKYQSLKSQLDPHFLFNSLNVLSSLIIESPKRAEKYTVKLSRIYRYVLEVKNNELVTIQQELKFATDYLQLLKIRFENAVSFSIEVDSSVELNKIIPLSIQLLLENAVRHNSKAEHAPLKVSVTVEANYLVVKNTVNSLKSLVDGTQLGLKNIINRYNLITYLPVIIEKNTKEFIVKLPILPKNFKYMETQQSETKAYQVAREKVSELKDFYSSLASYFIVNLFLIIIWYIMTPNGFQWFWFPLIGWGIGLGMHAAKLFLNTSNWEERKVKEYMDKNRF